MKYFLLLSSILPACYCNSAVWQVGPSRTYTLPSQVSSLVQNGDTVDIDAGIYTADVAHWTANNLLLRGVGTGYVHLKANNTSYGQKGIWVIGGKNVSVRHIEFSHCHDAAGVDKNWAGIRQEGLNLTVDHCYFHDNDNGILAGTLNPSKIVIQFTEFGHNGYGDGYSHNLYINHVDTLVFSYNYSHHATIGHELKSRANVNYILYNRFSNEATGDASREIDLPNGGLTVLLGNIIEQGPNSSNSGIVGYGLEGLTNLPPNELYLVNNTIVNDKSNGTFIALQAGMNLYKAYNNIFAGSGTLLSGSAASMDTSKNWRVSTVTNAGFVNAGSYDYKLIGTSQAINTGANAGIANNGFSLTPLFAYAHPADSVIRNISGVIDIGAYEFVSGTGVNNGADLQEDFRYSVAEGNLTVVSSVSCGTISIYDVSGKKILTEQIRAGISLIDIRGVSKGIYLLELRTEKGVCVWKFFR